jgi:DnaK suppressor protein
MDAALDLDLDDVRRRLEKERAELRASSEERVADRHAVELDQPSVGRLSRMDALQGQAMAQATEERRQLRIDAIEAALERLDDGSFGICVRCGEPIAPKRLALDLTVPTCITCAERSD